MLQGNIPAKIWGKTCLHCQNKYATVKPLSKEPPPWWAESLNRRAAVEQEMWNCVAAKKAVGVDQIAEWARRLGIPDEYRKEWS